MIFARPVHLWAAFALLATFAVAATVMVFRSVAYGGLEPAYRWPAVEAPSVSIAGLTPETPALQASEPSVGDVPRVSSKARAGWADRQSRKRSVDKQAMTTREHEERKAMGRVELPSEKPEAVPLETPATDAAPEPNPNQVCFRSGLPLGPHCQLAVLAEAAGNSCTQCRDPWQEKEQK